MRLNGAVFSDLKEHAAANNWGVSDRQIWTYVAKSDELMAQDYERSRKLAYRRHISQRRRLYAQAVNDGDARTALAILRDEAEMRGLYPPKRTELTGKGGKDLAAIQHVTEIMVVSEKEECQDS